MTDPYITQRDIKAQRKAQWKNFENWRNIIVAQVFSIGGNIEVPNKPDYVWIHEWGSDLSPAQAMRGGVTVVDGMPVLVSKDPREPYNWKIIGVYTGGLLPGVDHSLGRYESTTHGANHQMPSEDNIGPDPVRIWAPAYMPLKCEGNGTNLIVSIWGEISYWYGGVPRIATGNAIDMTLYMPSSGNTKYVLVYLDLPSGYVKAVGGAEIAIGNTPNYPVTPSNALPSAIVQLTFGQTAIATVDDIVDARGSFGVTTNNYDDILVSEAGDVMTDAGYVLWD